MDLLKHLDNDNLDSSLAEKREGQEDKERKLDTFPKIKCLLMINNAVVRGTEFSYYLLRVYVCAAAASASAIFLASRADRRSRRALARPLRASACSCRAFSLDLAAFMS